MSAHHLPPWLQRDREGAGAGPDYQRISVLGRTIIDRKTVEHTIRVFAQVEGLKRQAIATSAEAPGDADGPVHAEGRSGFRTRADACDVGCMAACERAAVGARAPHAVDDCRTMCVLACNESDPATGKFSCVRQRQESPDDSSPSAASPSAHHQPDTAYR